MGVEEDIRVWWPLLKRGGLMAGHDYMTQEEVWKHSGPRWKENNWTTNADGTIDDTGLLVKGAVDNWAELHGLQVSVTYREGAWNSWMLRKP